MKKPQQQHRERDSVNDFLVGVLNEQTRINPFVIMDVLVKAAFETKPTILAAAFHRTIAEAYASNAFRRMRTEERNRKRKGDTQSQSTRIAALEARISSTVRSIKQKVLMDFIMPNDLTLGDCMKDDLTAVGGWVAALAVGMPPNKRVRDVYTETELREMLESAMAKVNNRE